MSDNISNEWRNGGEHARQWVQESRSLMLALNSNNFWREKKKKNLRGTERSRMHHRQVVLVVMKTKSMFEVVMKKVNDKPVFINPSS